MTIAQLPPSRVAFVDAQGLPTQAFYRFMLSFFKGSGGTSIEAAALETMLFAGAFNPKQDPTKPDLYSFATRPPMSATFGLADVMEMLTTIQSYAGQIDALTRRVAALENLAAVNRVANL